LYLGEDEMERLYNEDRESLDLIIDQTLIEYKNVGGEQIMSSVVFYDGIVGDRYIVTTPDGDEVDALLLYTLAGTLLFYNSDQVEIGFVQPLGASYLKEDRLIEYLDANIDNPGITRIFIDPVIEFITNATPELTASMLRFTQALGDTSEILVTLLSWDTGDYRPYFVPKVFFDNFSDGQFAGFDSVLIGNNIVINYEHQSILKDGDFFAIIGEVANDIIVSLSVDTGGGPIEVGTFITPLVTRIEINSTEYLAYIDSTGSIHMLRALNVGINIFEGAARTYLELARESDPVFMDSLMAALEPIYGSDEDAIKGVLISFAADLYLGLDRSDHPIYDIPEVKTFMWDLASFIRDNNIFHDFLSLQRLISFSQ